MPQKTEEQLNDYIVLLNTEVGRLEARVRELKQSEEDSTETCAKEIKRLNGEISRRNSILENINTSIEVAEKRKEELAAENIAFEKSMADDEARIDARKIEQDAREQELAKGNSDLVAAQAALFEKVKTYNQDVQDFIAEQQSAREEKKKQDTRTLQLDALQNDLYKRNEWITSREVRTQELEEKCAASQRDLEARETAIKIAETDISKSREENNALKSTIDATALKQSEKENELIGREAKITEAESNAAKKQEEWATKDYEMTLRERDIKLRDRAVAIREREVRADAAENL